MNDNIMQQPHPQQQQQTSGKKSKKIFQLTVASIVGVQEDNNTIFLSNEKHALLLGLKRDKFGENAWSGCSEILNKLMNVEMQKYCINTDLPREQTSWIFFFNAPVDPVKLNIPDYFKVIKELMDLGTIRTYLDDPNRPNYARNGFYNDVCLTFDNAMNYYGVGSVVHTMAKLMKDKFYKLSSEIPVLVKNNKYGVSGRLIKCVARSHPGLQGNQYHFGETLKARFDAGNNLKIVTISVLHSEDAANLGNNFLYDVVLPSNGGNYVHSKWNIV